MSWKLPACALVVAAWGCGVRAAPPIVPRIRPAPAWITSASVDRAELGPRPSHGATHCGSGAQVETPAPTTLTGASATLVSDSSPVKSYLVTIDFPRPTDVNR